MSSQYDLVVIGGGSGGVRASRWAAQLGAKVAIVEKDQFGGTCVIRGCVPKKIMVIASHLSQEIATQKNFGWSIEKAKFSWQKLKQSRDKEVERLSGIYEGLLGKAGVDVIHGEARISSPSEVTVGSTRLMTKNILIATGSRPRCPDIEGSEHILTSDGFFHEETQAQRVVLIGAGYIGVELAGIYHGLGSETHIVAKDHRVLNRFDDEVSFFLTEALKQKGLHLHLETKVESVKKVDKGYEVNLDTGKCVSADRVIASIGRIPNTTNLGLSELGVKLDHQGSIVTDENMQTNVEGIYALGDVANKLNLTPVATAEAMWLAEKLFAKNSNSKEKFDYDGIPTAVFSEPPVATVGLTEQKCKERKIEYKCYKAQFRPLKHTISQLEERSFIKLIVDKKTDRVLGCHIVGDDSPEILQGFAVAIKMGATKAQFDQTIGIHPTIAEELVTLRE